jgi:hypothetical protein
LEARLVAARGGETVIVSTALSAVPESEPIEEVSAPVSEGAPNAWPDESTEAAMVSELKSRGEPVIAVRAEPIEEIDPKKLPPLDELVKRLTPEVRETLDDLFRAKFVRVTRVPAKALKE